MQQQRWYHDDVIQVRLAYWLEHIAPDVFSTYKDTLTNMIGAKARVNGLTRDWLSCDCIVRESFGADQAVLLAGCLEVIRRNEWRLDFKTDGITKTHTTTYDGDEHTEIAIEWLGTLFIHGYTINQYTHALDRLPFLVANLIAMSRHAGWILYSPPQLTT